MTKEEGLNKLIEFCDNEIKRSGWLVFNKKTLIFEGSKLLKDYEKDANLPLPQKLNLEDVQIDLKGIKVNSKFYRWEDICASGVKTEKFSDEINPEWRFEACLLFCLNNGSIIEAELGNIKHLHGQLVHFLEQYKLGKINP